MSDCPVEGSGFPKYLLRKLYSPSERSEFPCEILLDRGFDTSSRMRTIGFSAIVTRFCWTKLAVTFSCLRLRFVKLDLLDVLTFSTVSVPLIK